MVEHSSAPPIAAADILLAPSPRLVGAQ